jgi:hypothetical protein
MIVQDSVRVQSRIKAVFRSRGVSVVVAELPDRPCR